MGFEKVEVAPPSDLAAKVREAVDSGDYATIGEVIREALWVWDRKRSAKVRDIAKLQAMIAEGHASGSAPWEGPDEMLALIHAQARAAQR